MRARSNWVALRAAADQIIGDVRKAEAERRMGQPFSMAFFRWRAARRAIAAEAVARRVYGLDAADAWARFNTLAYQVFLP